MSDEGWGMGDGGWVEKDHNNHENGRCKAQRFTDQPLLGLRSQVSMVMADG